MLATCALGAATSLLLSLPSGLVEARYGRDVGTSANCYDLGSAFARQNHYENNLFGLQAGRYLTRSSSGDWT